MNARYCPWRLVNLWRATSSGWRVVDSRLGTRSVLASRLSARLRRLVMRCLPNARDQQRAGWRAPCLPPCGWGEAEGARRVPPGPSAASRSYAAKHPASPACSRNDRGLVSLRRKRAFGIPRRSCSDSHWKPLGADPGHKHRSKSSVTIQTDHEAQIVRYGLPVLRRSSWRRL